MACEPAFWLSGPFQKRPTNSRSKLCFCSFASLLVKEIVCKSNVFHVQNTFKKQTHFSDVEVVICALCNQPGSQSGLCR